MIENECFYKQVFFFFFLQLLGELVMRICKTGAKCDIFLNVLLHYLMTKTITSLIGQLENVKFEKGLIWENPSSAGRRLQRLQTKSN